MASALSPEARRLNNVQAARRIKNGSPKIREVLRERCRKRMHEIREELFMKRRQGLTNYSQEVKDALTDIVHKEFTNITSMDWVEPISNIEQSTNNVLFDEETDEIEESFEEQWILEEYQKILWEQRQISSLLDDGIYCPVCCKNLLQQVQSCAVCFCCNFKLPVQNGFEHLKQNIKEQANTHSAACLGIPKLSVFQENDNVSLYFSCPQCDLFAFV